MIDDRYKLTLGTPTVSSEYLMLLLVLIVRDEIDDSRHVDRCALASARLATIDYFLVLKSCPRLLLPILGFSEKGFVLDRSKRVCFPQVLNPLGRSEDGCPGRRSPLPARRETRRSSRQARATGEGGVRGGNRSAPPVQ